MALTPNSIRKLIYFVGFLDMLGVSFVFPLFSKYVRSLGVSPSVAGIIGSVYGGLGLFSSPLVGHWSDTSGRRYVLLLTLLLASASYFILGLTSSLLMCVVSRIIAGLFKHTQDLSRAYLSDTTPKDEHSKVFGMFNGVSTLGFVVGPTLGGHIGQIDGGFHICTTLCGILFLVNCGVIWLFIPENIKHSKDVLDKTKRGVNLNPLQFLRKFTELEWTNLWDVFLVKFLMGFAVLLYRSNFSMWIDYKFQASTVVIGYLTSLSAITGTTTGFLVGYIASYYDNNNSKILFHACCTQMIVIGSLTFAPNLWFVAALTMVLSIANANARVAATNLTIERGKGQETGTLLGLGGSILSVARMMSPSVGGFAQEMHESGPTIIGSIVAVFGVSTMLISKEFRTSLFKDKTSLISGIKEKRR